MVEYRRCANVACGAKFTPSRDWQKFCSAKCRTEYHYGRKPDKVFEIDPTDKTILLIVRQS